MKLGVYTACLHDKPLTEALEILSDLGLDSAEINSGGFVPSPHLPSTRRRGRGQPRRSPTMRSRAIG